MSRFVSILGNGFHYSSCKHFLNGVMFAEHVSKEQRIWYSQYNHTVITNYLNPNTQHCIIFYGVGSNAILSEAYTKGLKYDLVWPDHLLPRHNVYQKRPCDHYLPPSDEVNWKRFFEKLKVNI